MTLQTSSMGLMANHRNIINASDYATADARIVQSSGYADDDYVKCVVPDKGMIEIGPLPDLSLVGPYKFYIHGYTGTSTDYLDVYLDVYEDDELVTWSTGNHTDGELVVQTYTPEVWISFDPDKEYRLVIRTGDSTSDSNPTCIDYIHLQQLDYDFADTATWRYDERHTVTGGGAEAYYYITDALPVISSVRSGHISVYQKTPYHCRPRFMQVDSTTITTHYTPDTGTLPATFTAYISVVADIELPYVRGHGDV